MKLIIDIHRDWSGDDVRALRVRHGLTQDQLAELLGVRPSIVSDWESGRFNIARPTDIALSYLDLDLGGICGRHGNGLGLEKAALPVRRPNAVSSFRVPI